jgi:hypothetical protein
MGVKVKTPSPFVGAGSVATVTPNLSGMGSAIAGVADDLLTTRFEDRKISALEQAEIDSHDFINYDDNGKLKPITFLPKDNTWYSQGIRANAKTNYFNALGTDLKNFTTKTLAEFPNDPNAVKEQMDINAESAITDLDESLVGYTQALTREYTNEAVLKAQGNLYNKQRADSIVNGEIAIKQVEDRGYAGALLNNRPLSQGDINQWEAGYKDQIFGHKNGYSLEAMPKMLTIFKSRIEVHRDVSKAQKFIAVLNNPVNESPETISYVKDKLVDMGIALQKKYSGSVELSNLATEKWNEIVTIAENNYNEKEVRRQKIKTKKQSENNLNYNVLLMEKNLSALDWLNNPDEISKKISNEDITISQVQALLSGFHAQTNANEAKIQLVNSKVLLDAFERGKVTDLEMQSNEYIMNDATALGSYLKIRKAKNEKTDSDLIKFRSEHTDLNVTNIVNYMPDLIQDSESILHWGNEIVTVEEVKKFLFEKGFVKKENFEAIGYNQSGAIEKILTARKSAITFENKKQSVNKAINYSIDNNTKLSDADHKSYLEVYKFDEINLKEMSRDDVLKNFQEHNERYLTLNGAIGDILDNPLNIKEGNIDKLIPLVSTMLNVGEDGYSAKANKMFYAELSPESQKFWLELFSNMEDSNVSDSLKISKLKLKKDVENKDGEGGRNKSDKTFYASFGAMPQKSYNSDYGGSLVEQYPAFGLTNIVNSFRAANILVGKTSSLRMPLVNEGMDKEYIYQAADGSIQTQTLDKTNRDDVLKYIGHNYNNIGGDSEGPWAFIQDWNKFTDERNNDPQFRKIVERWGGLGSLSNMDLPMAVKEETLDRYRNLWDINNKPYARYPERRDKALFRLTMEVLQEGNYTPELSGVGGILSREGNLTDGYTLKWVKNGLTNAMANTGWQAADIKVTPALMGQEISHMMHNQSWNKDPNNPGQPLFKPSDFSKGVGFDYTSFHEVDWMIKPNGTDKDGNPVAEIYYYDHYDNQQKPLQVKLLYEKDDLEVKKNPELLGTETGEVATVTYPYGYKNSFYNAILKDQTGTIEKYINEHPKLQKGIGGATVKKLAEIYLNGINIFGLDDPTGISGNFMTIVMEAYETQNRINGKIDNHRANGESNEDKKNYIFDDMRNIIPYKIDNKSQNLPKVKEDPNLDLINNKYQNMNMM